MKKLYNFFGVNNVLPISTTGTEGSKSIVLSTFRAYDIDPDIAQRISDTIPVDRGKNWPLKDCIFGNADADRESIPLMQKYYKQYKEPLDIAMSLEGLINKRSSHASGILIYPEDYLNYNSMMKAPSGLEISSYTMEDSQFCGGIKEDLLYTEFESKLQLCLEIMRKHKLIKGENPKELYQFITPANLNQEDENVWKNIFHSGNVKDVFQMEGSTGIDICQKVKPSNILELSAANSLMRLKSDINVEFIASQEGFNVTVTDFMKQLFENEQLSDKFLRYKNNPQEFIDDTIHFGLTKEWAEKIYSILQDTYGVCVSQEDLMRLCMEIFDFNITEAHKARKGVAKKKGKLIEECRLLIIERAKNLNIPSIVPFYVWLLIMGTAAYSFSVVHAYSYSLIGYQGAFLKYYYPLYWHTACLTINAQAADIEDEEKEKYLKALEEEDEEYIKATEEELKKKNKTSDYAKLSKAIFDLRQEGVDVSCPDINKSEMGFSVDEETNSILYGLKALDGIGDEIAKQIIDLRPYSSFQDFLQKNVLFNFEDYPTRKKLDKNAILSLIFSNSFNGFQEKNSSLILQYMEIVTTTIEKLNTRYLEDLLKIKALPAEYECFIAMKKYMPKIKKYQDENDKKIWKIPKYGEEQSSLVEHVYDFYYSCIKDDDEKFIYLDKRLANQIYKDKETNVKTWMSDNEDVLKGKLNNIRIKQEFLQWTKGKLGSDLAFKAMGFYPKNSWLDDAAEKYNISEYLKLPRADENIINYGTYKGLQYPIFKISQIPITVIEKNSKHKTVTGMTKGAVINLKFKTEVYDYYSSYFERGEKLIVWGYRGNKDDTFTVKLYGSVKKTNPDTHTVIKV